ncbi:hypothetical protein LguiA_016854 [Lonicera macranthoides]
MQLNLDRKVYAEGVKELQAKEKKLERDKKSFEERQLKLLRHSRILGDILQSASLIKVRDMCHLISNYDDVCVWTPDTNGKFSLGSTWNIVRNKQNYSRFGSWIWSRFIPLKWSIMTWRALRGRLPVDDAVQKMGIHLASKCVCVVQSQEENL